VRHVAQNGEDNKPGDEARARVDDASEQRVPETSVHSEPLRRL